MGNPLNFTPAELEAVRFHFDRLLDGNELECVPPTGPIVTNNAVPNRQHLRVPEKNLSVVYRDSLDSGQSEHIAYLLEAIAAAALRSAKGLEKKKERLEKLDKVAKEVDDILRDSPARSWRT